MRQLSFWARAHKWESRAMIGLIYILVNLLGICSGKWLLESGVILPQSWLIACVILTIGLWMVYPAVKARSGAGQVTMYFQRKLIDFGLGIVTFLMIIYGGNNFKNMLISNESLHAFSVHRPPTDSSLYANPLIKNFIGTIRSKDISKLSQREKMRLIKDQVRKIRHDRENSQGSKVLLIVLSVFLALVLLYGLAALACSISCSGSEALAVVVAVCGTALIIFLLVLVIKRIINPREPKKQNGNPAGSVVQ